MATINRKLQLRDVQGNLVFPRASLDNIQRSKNDGRDAIIVTLDDSGHIDTAILPSAASSVDMLLAIAIAAPVGAVVGDKYYNITQNKVYTYSGSSWGNAVTPSVDKLYVTKNDNNIYRYDGTSTMIDVSTHFTVLQSVANDPADASSTGVPSEHAVSVALQKKQDKMSGVAPISVDGTGAISLRYSSGLAVEGNNLTVPQSYITGTVDDLMMRDADPASPETAIVDGGTVYSILGNYEVTNTISTTVVEDTRVPTEKAVRDAINAYVATGGSSVTAGKAINVDGGSINVTTATTEDTLEGYETLIGATVATPIEDRVVTPGGLRGALSFGQAVDVSCSALSTDFTKISTDGGTTWQDMTQALRDSSFLSEFIIETTNSNCYFGWTGSGLFPKYATGLKYLFIFDFKISGRDRLSIIKHEPPNGAVTSKWFIGNSDTWKRAWVIAETPRVYLSDNNYTTPLRITIKNWRQYEVTALTDEAIAYIAQLPDPDAFFRSTSVYSLRDKYLVKQDMVCPFIPTISMPDNSDLTVGAGLAYKLKYTDSNVHKITVDTIPENGYGWDAHLQLFVKDTANVAFVPPLNLLDPLTPNAGQNLTVKFRNGQANVYVDDIDVGYVVSVASGSTYGSLSYGLMNDVGEYIVFSNGLDGVNVEYNISTAGVVARQLTVIGNGPDKTNVVQSGLFPYYTKCIFQNLSLTTTETSNNGAGNITDLLYYIFGFVNCKIYDITVVGSHHAIGFGSRSCHVNGCWFENVTGSSTSGIAYFPYGGEVTGSTFTNINGFMCVEGYYSPGENSSARALVVSNCIFDRQHAGRSIYPRNTPLSISDCSFSQYDNINIGGSTTTFSGTNILNSTVSGSGSIVFANGSTVTSTGDGSEGNPKGAFIGAGRRITPAVWDGTTKHVFQNVEFTKGYAATEEGAGIYVMHSCDFINCVITGNTSATNNAGGFACRTIYNQVPSTINITGSTFNENSNPHSSIGNLLLTQNGSTFNITNSIIQNPYFGTHGFYSIVNSEIVGNMILDSTASRTVIINIEGMCDLHGMQRYNVDLGTCIFRYIGGSTVTNTAAIPATLNLQMLVGSYDVSNPYLWTVNGSFTAVMPNGTVSISGIGTYINSDGTNDFSPIYTVANTDASGAGSLLYGLVGSTKYVVVSHSVTSCSAVLNTNVNRVLHVCTGDGRSIVGGSVSILNGSTVTTYTPTDEHGAHMVDGSTVAILGNTASFGSMQLSGTLQLDHDCTVLPSSTITGVGGGARIESTTWRSLVIFPYNTTLDISNVSLRNIEFNGAVSPHSVTLNITGCTINLDYDGTGTSHLVNLFNAISNVNAISCDINTVNVNSCISKGDGRTTHYTNCTIRSGYIIGSNCYWEFKNCYCAASINYYAGTSGYLLFDGTTMEKRITIQSGNYPNQKIIIKNTFKLDQSIDVLSGNSTSVVYVVSGSTINLTNVPSSTTKPIAAGNSIKVGTFGTEFTFSTWTTGGTATVLLPGGSTMHISGEGTYINRNGTTDLNVVS